MMFHVSLALITGLVIHRNPKPESLVKPLPLDPRMTRLAAFFERYQCPQPYFIHDYLLAADSYAIDYRLLPAISVRESTCGRHHRLTNRWGWDVPRTGFESVPDGIDYIAAKLAAGRPYKGKTLKHKLRAYNPYPQYATQIVRLMREIEDLP